MSFALNVDWKTERTFCVWRFNNYNVAFWLSKPLSVARKPIINLLVQIFRRYDMDFVRSKNERQRP